VRIYELLMCIIRQNKHYPVSYMFLRNNFFRKQYNRDYCKISVFVFRFLKHSDNVRTMEIYLLDLSIEPTDIEETTDYYRLLNKLFYGIYHLLYY
jgi:hypothetical protein